MSCSCSAENAASASPVRHGTGETDGSPIDQKAAGAAHVPAAADAPLLSAAGTAGLGPQEVHAPPVPPVPVQPLVQPSVQTAPSAPSPQIASPDGPTANHADPDNKYTRGPVLQRSHGPSLLTRALASARGIPPQPEQHRQQQQQQQCPDPTDQEDADNDTSQPSDGDSLTPRGSPRSGVLVMSSAAVAPSSPVPPVFDMMDLRDIQSTLNCHRDFLQNTKARGTSLERTFKDRPTQARPSRLVTSCPNSGQKSALLSPRFCGSVSPAGSSHVDENGDSPSEPKEQGCLRHAEQRLALGPEKAWSIGTGEASHVQDGQVERSINEVLAGVEPNARSRKASHSLRFFKEGLPDDTKKREPRTGSGVQLREKLLAEGLSTAERDGQGSSVIQEHVDDRFEASRPVRPRSTVMRSPEEPAIGESPEDDPLSEQALHGRADGVIRDFEGLQDVGDAGFERGKPVTANDARVKARNHKPKAKENEGNEDGDESGEEKISSAVFLPHQGLEQNQEQAAVARLPPGASNGGRNLQRAEDFHAWLVKADEPESDENRAERDSYNECSKLGRPCLLATASEGKSADGDKARTSARTLRPTSQSQHLDEHVHEHQLAPKQPLDAIELIPYKHQVGGHTTIWRFSRRAVCKQLNNRENEFYETVEKYHRDLLQFLPKYIGVLNVTFKKQPRRKSTVKRDEAVPAERKQVEASEVDGPSIVKENGVPMADVGSCGTHPRAEVLNGHRVISQSLQSTQVPVPTVTFVDNQHILPRSLLQPPPQGADFFGRQGHQTPAELQPCRGQSGEVANRGVKLAGHRSMDLRPKNSWGATTVNKKLRNEVFNDAFLKQPIAIQRHRKGLHRTLPRALHGLRPANSDPSLARAPNVEGPKRPSGLALKGQPDGPDVTGTSAPEPAAVGQAATAIKRKRRYSGTALRRKPKDVRDPRGHLQLFEEPDEAGYKGDNEDVMVAEHVAELLTASTTRAETHGLESESVDEPTPGTANQTSEPARISRPINPKEAQTQHDSRVEYFLLLEDLTAGMKRPCIMDLKMGTRQYGVDAKPHKQESQQGKCAKTTSRELGVRVCGLQVWDVAMQSYVFKDKYYGRDLRAGQEFQAALTRFLYDGVDRASILRHIPTVLEKLGQLEVIIRRLRGYRFYAASLLMFYDGDKAPSEPFDSVEDSTTDFATDTEDGQAPRAPRRRSKRDIDFKMADFANSVTAGDPAIRDKPCPPTHPDQPDRGFLRGLRSLRRTFLDMQRCTRADMGLVTPLHDQASEDDEDSEYGEMSVSE